MKLYEIDSQHLTIDLDRIFMIRTEDGEESCVWMGPGDQDYFSIEEGEIEEAVKLLSAWEDRAAELEDQ